MPIKQNHPGRVINLTPVTFFLCTINNHIFMKRILLIVLLVAQTFLVTNAEEQKRFSISGIVKDTKNGEELVGATIAVKELKTGVTTNAYGFYSISLLPGNYTIEVSYLGYETQQHKIELTADVKLNISLVEQQRQLKEIVISENKEEKHIKQTKMSVVTMEMKEVKKIPLLMGEMDVIKAVQLLPGIQAAGDGSTNMIVRGGNIDQNLILLDEAIVYNPSHAVGFFSVFNGDAVKDFDIYKGGIPAQFGGRISSVMDVRMRDGNHNKFGVSGGIGVLSSRLTAEGPIAKDKASFIVSGRRTYFDLFMKASSDEAVSKSAAGFYDLNAKVNVKLGEKDRLFVSGYFGKDYITVAGIFKNGWGNQTGTIRWNHLFNKKIFSNTTLIFSRFNYNFGLDIPTQEFDYDANITNISFKEDMTYYITPKHTLRFGTWLTYHLFKPGELTPSNDNTIYIPVELDRTAAFEQNYYLSHQYEITNKLGVEYGIRFSAFSNVGNNNTTYVLDQARTGILDSVNQSSGNIYNTYFNFEPRINVRYSLNENSSIKLSYNRMAQYLHMVSPITASTGQDMWIASSPNIKPQTGDQVAIGYFRNIGKLEASVESYYKEMNNVVDLRDNANDLLLNKAIEREVRQGKGTAYGIEFMLRKPQGRATGWVSYALAKTDRKIDGVNEGKVYPFRFDRRHNINIVASYSFSDRVNLSANWVFASGESVTMPVGRYEYEGRVVPKFSSRNAYKIDAYHRMDLSLTLYRKKVEGKKFKNESSWVFSLYNAYGRKNIYSITFNEKTETLKDANGNVMKDEFGNEKIRKTGETEAIKTYLFTFVPGITYNFKF